MTIAIIPVPGVPMVTEGMPLAEVVGDALAAARVGLKDGDVVAVCQKVVSKAEGALAVLAEVEPSAFADTLAAQGEMARDARVLEVVLRESARIVRNDRGHLITETHHGYVCANAGVDQSNGVAEGVLTLLPRDPDRSAEELRRDLADRFGSAIGVVVTDTFGRPWREGLVDVAIGCAGLPPLIDHGGTLDLGGRELRHTVMAFADQIATAAGLVMEKGAGIAVAIVRGARWTPAPPGAGGAKRLVRGAEFDLFR
jgi:coenzyme F420-0:L-glutamate ligase/coenzyme F420-1:gamma-L-glutamate ligase